MSLLLENIMKKLLSEESQSLTDRQKEIILALQDEWAREVFGKDYHEENDENAYDKKMTDLFFNGTSVKLKNNLNISGGMFSIGNQKLSKDTLIINFTSALGCPSINDCPISQKACYAVAGEVRLKDTRRKHLMVQRVVKRAASQKMMGGFFKIAEEYVRLKTSKRTKEENRIKYIRYNEDGDFINQDILEMAADFSARMLEKYNVRSFAYTANKKLDISQKIMTSQGEMPIDHIIAFNLSREDIKKSEDGVFKKFYGMDMPYEGFSTNPEINLEHAYADVESVNIGQENIKVLPPQKDDKSVPTLAYGKFGENEGWYYVCPCSFWAYKKGSLANDIIGQEGFEKIRNAFAELHQAKPKNKGYEFLANVSSFPSTNTQKKWVYKGYETVFGEDALKELKKQMDTIKSPCGIYCAVCHNMVGGVSEDGSETNIKDYTILTNTHGATKGNLNVDYANALRQGQSAVFNKFNKNGVNRDYTIKQMARSIASGKMNVIPKNGLLYNLHPSEAKVFMKEFDKNGGMSKADPKVYDIIELIKKRSMEKSDLETVDDEDDDNDNLDSVSESKQLIKKSIRNILIREEKRKRKLMLEESYGRIKDYFSKL